MFGFKILESVLKHLVFKLDRTQGSHHIYVHSDLPEMLNIQNVKGKAKPYQIKQFLDILERNNLEFED